MYLETCVALILAKVVLRLFPFRWVTRSLAIQVQPQRGKVPDQIHDDLRDWARALNACARHLPFSATCLVQAVAGSMLLKLRRRNIAIWIGVKKSPDGTLAAHAWLLCDDRVVTGGTSYGDYHILAKMMGDQPPQS